MSEPSRDFLPPMTDLVLLFAAHGLVMGGESFVPLGGVASRADAGGASAAIAKIPMRAGAKPRPPRSFARA
jgi:hypothetical protein